jgi:hypothetical protein
MVAVAQVLDHRDRTLVQRFGLVVFALLPVDGCEADQRESELVDGRRGLGRRQARLRAISRHDFFTDRQRAPEQGLGFGEPVLLPVELSQAVENRCNVGILGAERSPP